MKITFTIVLDDAYLKREVDWPAVPRVGDSIELTEGWSEDAYRVWWDVTNGEVTVELGQHADAHGEDLTGSLTRSGWT